VNRDDFLEQSENMEDLIVIRDPRNLAEEGSGVGVDQSASIFLPYDGKPIRDAVLLCNLLWAFPTEMVLYLIAGPPKKVAKMWDCFTPERQIHDYIGIVSATDSSRLGLTNFFDSKGSWFEWYFVGFEKHQLTAIESEVANKSCFADNADPFAKYAQYSIRCNRDMGQTEVLIYDKRLFDPMIDLMRVLPGDRLAEWPPSI
jgi:hypothetical protein